MFGTDRAYFTDEEIEELFDRILVPTIYTFRGNPEWTIRVSRIFE